jgi:hypothetical protein
MTGGEFGEGLAVQVHVASSTVAARATPGYQALLLQNLEMVGEKIGRDPREFLQLPRRAIGPGKLVDD